MKGAGPAARIGWFGGTFDPVHNGHVAIAAAAVGELGLDLLHVAPCGSPPHRPAAQAAGAIRLAMLRCAFAGLPAVRLDDRELRRSGPSYTMASVRELVQLHGVERIWLVLGEDALMGLPDWHEPRALLQSVHLAVAERAAGAGDTAADSAWQRLARQMGAQVRWLRVDAPDVSSTQIRRYLAAGSPVDELVAPAVLAYIRTHGLYGTDSMRKNHL